MTARQQDEQGRFWCGVPSTIRWVADFIGGPGRTRACNQTVMSGRIQLGLVDCIFIGDRACSLRFGAVVSGAKLVRCVSRCEAQRATPLWPEYSVSGDGRACRSTAPLLAWPVSRP